MYSKEEGREILKKQKKVKEESQKEIPDSRIKEKYIYKNQNEDNVQDIIFVKSFFILLLSQMVELGNFCSF